MRVGTLCYSTEQGLGILAKSFYDAGVVTDPIVVNYTARGTRPMHPEWYPNAPHVSNVGDLNNLLPDPLPDVMLLFETPFNWNLIDHCRSKGVKTALMVMHECLDNRVHQHIPDLFLCPSLLDYEAVKDIRPSEIVFLPVPVQVPWRLRTRAEVFVHNAGHGGLRGRNGTTELIHAYEYVKSPSKLILRSQNPMFASYAGTVGIPLLDPRIEVRTPQTVPFANLWSEGDVFVFPEKFNGLSLPLQEARAAGMLVMCGDRFPMNTWLPREPLIPVSSYNKDVRTFPQFHPFDEAVFDPKTIAAKIDEWYGRDITEYSLQGKAWAESMSWQNLKPRYLEVLSQLCGQSG